MPNFTREQTEERSVLYFSEVYMDTPRPPLPMPPIIFPRVVSEIMNAWLVQTPLEEEIRTTFFSLSPEKAPGPDGFTIKFIQTLCPELRSTIMGCTRDFFQGKPLLQSINHTLITLVPKKPTASELFDFRPISCVNLIYKLITKNMASRMMEFMQGRTISDNTLLTDEMLHCFGWLW